MKITKVFQRELYDIDCSESDECYPALQCEIQSWEDGNSSVCIYGHDGNLMAELSLQDIKDGSYPGWCHEIFEELDLT